MECECAFALPAITWFPLVHQDARHAGHNSFLVASTKGMCEGRLLRRSQAQALHRPWRRLPLPFQLLTWMRINADTATVAEPELEVDVPPSEAEQEPDEEMFREVPDLEEEENAAPDDERRPVILPGRTSITDPDLRAARSAMRPPCYPEKRIGR